jgi:hypothetical protein
VPNRSKYICRSRREGISIPACDGFFFAPG